MLGPGARTAHLEPPRGILAGGVIDAGGGGGGSISTGEKTGGGGGSGGAILLEAPVVSIDGTIAANGGGGSCFNTEGENGRIDGAVALGGNCDEAGYIGDGGNGATAWMPATNGGSITTTAGTGFTVIGGGGAGGVGRIRINTRSGDITLGGSALLTPLVSKGPLGLR